MSLETSLWFFALVVEYLCTEAETVTLFEAALLVYLLLYPTCLLVYLLLVLLVYLLLYPSFEVPLDCCVERTVIQLLHSVAPPIPAVSVC